MLTKVPDFVKKLYPRRIWSLPDIGKKLYLTFDDGPIPEVTPWVLEQLKTYDAKATFFCIGENVEKHPDIFRQLLAAGHSVANHTYNHLNGWKTPADEYLQNVLLAQETMKKSGQKMSGTEEPETRKPAREEPETRSSVRTELQKKPSEAGKPALFRPPYGRLTGKQARLLEENNFKIVMWDVISRDYEKDLSPENCLKIVLRHTEAGSLVVFHDSLKAEKNLRMVLPQVLEYYSAKGFNFESLRI